MRDRVADYYELLGVSRDSNTQDIRKAYRTMARKYHPDLNKGDRKAENYFKKINEAYEVLSDDKKRRKYDTYGAKWNQINQGQTHTDWFQDLGFNFGGRKNASRSRRQSTSRLESPVTITLEEAFSGSNHNLTISSPTGERRIEVTVPAGVDNGSVVKVTPDRQTEIRLTVKVLPSERFKRNGLDLYTEIDVPFEDLIFGGEIQVKTFSGQLHLKIPERSQNGQKIRLSGQGMPVLKKNQGRGDLYVILRPILPTDLSEEELQLLKRFCETRDGNGA